MDNQIAVETQTFSDEFRRYFALLRQWAWLLTLAAVLCGVVAYLISRRMTPIYQASTTLLINEAPSNRSADYTSILTSERLARTYSEMLTKKPVVEAVIEELGLDVDAEDLQEEIQVDLVRDTQLIVVKVNDTDPQKAALIANTLVSVFSAQTQALQTSRYAASKENLEAQLARIDEQIQATVGELARLPNIPANNSDRERLDAALTQYRQTYSSLLQSYEQVRVAEAASTSNVVQVEAATPPEDPIRPRVIYNTALAVFLGLLVTMGLILLVDALDDTIRNPDDIPRVFGVSVLGLIVHHDTNGDQPITNSQPRSPVSESFRSLRTNLQFASVDHPLKTLLITSPSPSEGKTTVVSNLGVVLAQGGWRVVLVDADMRRPRLHKVLDLSNHFGMSNLFLQPEIQVDGALQKTHTDGLMAIPTGDLPPNPAELLGSEKMSEIMRAIHRNADLVIIDSPPVMAVTDSAVLAHWVDGVILVIKPGFTKMAAARQAVEQLNRVGANLLGVVMNDVDFGRSKYGYYYYKGYYYHYYYDEAGRKVRKRVKTEKKVRKAEPAAESQVK
ncbi:MAG: polysaccharide biosynthesis tyrosine autokinase [Anaerolineales bacterium]|nr:polysaccharide biosynthesis tyrosine autokinase [Anaerolineales bacterium]